MATLNENNSNRVENPAENAPLLGQPGDATQAKDTSLVKNLVLGGLSLELSAAAWVVFADELEGTAPIAQLGIWVLTGAVWGSILSKPKLFGLFTPHPLLNSVGILLNVQAILLLQPTHTQEQKIKGTYAHALLNDVGVLALVSGAIVIIYNKASHGGTHFESPHAILGLITYILLVLQVIVGGSAFFVPKMFGSVSRAKSLYKYHRMSGYLVLVLTLVTVALATETDFNKGSLHINLWAVVVASVAVLIGIVPRVKPKKLGL